MNRSFSSRRNRLVLGVIVALVALAIGALSNRAGTGDGDSGAVAVDSAAPRSTVSLGTAPDTANTATPNGSGATATTAPSTSRGGSGLDLVGLRSLPPEATATWKLIVQGGPYPYDRDGVTFENREKLLPIAARGFYHEYTVPTPGSSDRGARRMIVGGHIEVVFYTADHYGSFVEVDTRR